MEENIVALQISVYDGLGMQVIHALSRLSGYVDQFDHLELGLDDVQVVVQTGAFTPLGHDGQLGLGGVAHEEQDVHVTRFPEDSHFILECLKLLWRGSGDIQHLHCHITVPLSLEDSSKRSRAYPLTQSNLTFRDFPVITGVPPPQGFHLIAVLR